MFRRGDAANVTVLQESVGDSDVSRLWSDVVTRRAETNGAAGIFSGIFSAMLTYPTADEVFDQMGDKIVAGLASSVRSAAEDLAEYRRMCPRLAGAHKKRGYANVVHDYIWPHLEDVFECLDEVRIRDDEVTRELMIRGDFRVRVKKHSKTGAISSYHTQSALSFAIQDEDLFGGRIWNVAVGYVWDNALSMIETPVISLRDGDFEYPIWMEELPNPTSGSMSARRPLDGPPSPRVQATLSNLGEQDVAGDE